MTVEDYSKTKYKVITSILNKTYRRNYELLALVIWKPI